MVETVGMNRLRRLAWERHERDLETGHERGLYFDEAAADRVCEFFATYLMHHKGEWAGQPFDLEGWQELEVLRPIFGWKRADGTRRFRTAYVEIPRKNGKSTKAAGGGLYLLVADGEPGAEVYSSATKRDQAKIVFDAATAMVKASPRLLRFVKPFRNNLHVLQTGSKFEPLGADSSTLDGLNPHGNIVDEIHAHRDRTVYDVLVTGMGARRQPLTLIITTAGVYDPESIGWQMHDYAVKVLEGVIQDDSFFAFIAAADEDDDWQDPETWRKANPNYGISVKPDYLAEQAAKAAETPSFLNTFLRYHLNIWTQQVTRWLDPEKWKACEEPLGILDLLGRVCYGGLDLSSTTDLASLVLAFPRSAGFDLLCRFWCPEETVMKRAHQDRVPYDRWVEDGLITATPGNVIDYDFIRATISGPRIFEDPELQERVRRRLIDAGEPEEGLAHEFGLQEVGFDPYNATQLALQLDGDGVNMVPFRQGFVSMNEPSKEFERLMIQGHLRHGNHPVLTWMASNVSIREDAAGNIKPDKKASTERIDGVVAAIMAVGRATTGEREGPSVYEQRGVRTL